jgi:hypothetical protein
MSRLGMTQAQLAEVGRGIAGMVAGNPSPEPFTRPLPSGVERSVTKGSRVISSTDESALAIAAATLAAQAKTKPVEEEVEEEEPAKSESQIIKEERAAQAATLASIRADLLKLDPQAFSRPKVDPALATAQAAADRRKALIDDALKASAEKQTMKAKRKAAKALKRLGL